MTLMRESALDHGLLLDHDARGNRRLSVTLAGRTKKKSGKPLQSATGEQYDRCFQHASTVLWKMQGKHLSPQDQEPRQYHPVSEEEAVQVRLLMDAMNHVQEHNQANDVGRRIADMHPCESSWWYACAKNPSRPGRRVMEALTLMCG